MSSCRVDSLPLSYVTQLFDVFGVYLPGEALLVHPAVFIVKESPEQGDVLHIVP